MKLIYSITVAKRTVELWYQPVSADLWYLSDYTIRVKTPRTVTDTLVKRQSVLAYGLAEWEKQAGLVWAGYPVAGTPHWKHKKTQQLYYPKFTALFDPQIFEAVNAPQG